MSVLLRGLRWLCRFLGGCCVDLEYKIVIDEFRALIATSIGLSGKVWLLWPLLPTCLSCPFKTALPLLAPQTAATVHAGYLVT